MVLRMMKQRRAPVSRDEWATRVERWRRSGLPLQQFSDGAGLSARSLEKWASRLRQMDRDKPVVGEVAGSSESRGGFLELRAEVARVASFELSVGEYRLGVPASFDEGALGRLLEVLEARR
jgi:hypothetical protein